MTPDHIRKEVWLPALEKAGIEYRPPLQSRHTFATMMISAGEDVGWFQNMLGHSSPQMIFQPDYAWTPEQTRSDGQASIRQLESRAEASLQNAERDEKAITNLDKGFTNLVPRDKYRRRKKGLVFHSSPWHDNGSEERINSTTIHPSHQSNP